MKQKLLTIKSLLVAVLLGVGVNGAWATPTVIKSWDFVAISDGLESETTAWATYSAASTVRVSGTDCDVLNGDLDGLAMQGSGGWKLHMNNSKGVYSYKGLRQANGGGRLLVVMNLKAGDVVTMTSEGGLPTSATNGTYDSENSTEGTNCIYTVTADGHLAVSCAKNNTYKTISVTRDLADLEAPTYEITGVDGTQRQVTLSCLTDGAAIKYNTVNDKSADGWTTYSAPFLTSEATLYAYSEKSSTTSDIITITTGAGTAITLNAPSIAPSGMALSAGLYYPTVSISNSQAGLAIVPASTTLSYEFNDASVPASNPYPFTSTGTLKVTVSADGYTSNSATYIVNMPFLKTKTIDLTTITEGDLSDRWTGGTGAQLPHNNWKSNISDAEFPYYVYDYRSDDASNADVIDGLIVGISSKDSDPGITPTLYVGAGMILPTRKLNKSDLSESDTWNSNINISVSGATANEIAVYTYPTNYGSSTSTKTIAANENYGLYRYSDMLTKVEVYSPAVSVAVTAAGYATYVNSDYNLDFTSTTIKAYTAKVNTSTKAVELTKINKVPAGTPVLLYAEGGETEAVPVSATADTPAASDLIAGTGAAVATDGGEGKINYILNNVSGIGFYKAAGQVVATNRAYLQTTVDAAAAPMFLIFNDETTSIGASLVNNEQRTVNSVYNLAGQRVAQPTKGLYIVNGKKAIIK